MMSQQLLSQLFPPYLIRKAVALRASQLLWEQNEKEEHMLWVSDEDMEFCGNIISKSPTELTERDVLVVEMLSLKYADRPCDADLSKDRMLN